MLWQVPWGKHNPISFRSKHVAAMSKKLNINQTNVLPVVLIKDPYSWMGSMCRKNYAAHWDHWKNHCPNLMPDHNGGMPSEVTVRFQDWHKPKYESLVGFWNDWYGDYMAIDSFPRLIIRFEDMLFHLDEVMNEICQCAGGQMKGHVHMITESAKRHANTNGLLAALSRYGRDDKRTDGMTKGDLSYSQKKLRKDLMETFGYSFIPTD